MVKCPRCENMVDETQRTTCPICFTPLQTQQNSPPPGAPNQPTQWMAPPAQASAPPQDPNQPTQWMAPPSQAGSGAPPPQAPPPSYAAMQPGARVSLTGEVFQADTGPAQNEPPRPGSYAGAYTPPRPNSIPPLRPGAGTRINSPRGREVSSSRSGGGAGVVAAIAIVIVLALAGFGGWWFLSHRSNPKDQATKFLTAMKTLDWKTLKETSESAGAAPGGMNIDQQQQAIEKNPAVAGIVKNLFSTMDFKVDDPSYHEDLADVPVTMSIQGNEAMKGSLSMKRIDGVWKVANNKMNEAFSKNLNDSLLRGMGLGGGGRGGLGGGGGGGFGGGGFGGGGFGR